MRQTPLPPRREPARETPGLAAVACTGASGQGLARGGGCRALDRAGIGTHPVLPVQIDGANHPRDGGRLDAERCIVVGVEVL